MAKETQSSTQNPWERLSRDAQILWMRRYNSQIALLLEDPGVLSFACSQTDAESELFTDCAYRKIILVDRQNIEKSQVKPWNELLDYVSMLIEGDKQKLVGIAPDRNFRAEPDQLAAELEEKADFLVTKNLPRISILTKN